MKVHFITVGQWTSLLATLLIVSGTRAQMDATLQDLIAQCHKTNGANCDWLETYRQQMILNDLLPKIGDESRNQAYKYRHQVNPRETVYENTKESPPPQPQPPILFGSGYKSQYNRLYSTMPAASSAKLQAARRPFNYDNKRARYAFSSWGGKRASDDSGGGGGGGTPNTKREPTFSSWGGKRTQKFFNWGGKRSISDDAMQAVADENDQHNIMKRNVESAYKIADDRAKRLCVSESRNLQDLFREFVEWSRKQPEQKKGAALYRKILSATVPTLHSPDNLSRRAGSFYSWGGKRNMKDH